MAAIKNEMQYLVICERIEELLKVVHGDTPINDPNLIELDMLSDLVADYEEEHYPVKAPTLAEIMKERMYEMGISQTSLAKMLHVSPSRVSEYLSGKREPTLQVGREICKQMNVDANFVLGV